MRVDCLDRRVATPFYRTKCMIYNVRFKGDLPCKALVGLHHKTYGQLAL
jgi:hypothetical protein